MRQTPDGTAHVVEVWVPMKLYTDLKFYGVNIAETTRPVLKAALEKRKMELIKKLRKDTPGGLK